MKKVTKAIIKRAIIRTEELTVALDIPTYRDIIKTLMDWGYDKIEYHILTECLVEMGWKKG